MNSKKYLARVALSMALAASTSFTMAPIANAAELSQAKSTAEIHYGTVSKADQELLASMFDAEYYKKTNPDAVAAFGEDPAALFNHFITFGVFEGRSLNKDFNVNAYASAYDDLKEAFGDDILAYYRHYNAYAEQDKRTITTLAAAAAAGITVTSVADSTVVIPPAVYYVAERTGSTDLTEIQQIVNTNTAYDSSSSSSGGGGGSSSGGSSDSGSSDSSSDKKVEASVKLSATSLAFKFGDAAKKLTATCEGFTVKSVTWKSSDATIATVSNDGDVTPHSVGEATITFTATDGEKSYSATCTVTVSEASSGEEEKSVAVTGISLNKTTLSLEVGDTETLIATVLPENADDKRITWSSSNTEAVTVDTTKVGATNTVTAVGEGNATITAKTVDGDFVASCTVTVSEAEVENTEPASVTITGESSVTASADDAVTKTYTATVKNSDEDVLDGEEVEWSVDAGELGVTINSSTGELTVPANSEGGSVTITATVSGTEVSNTMVVTIVGVD